MEIAARASATADRKALRVLTRQAAVVVLADMPATTLWSIETRSAEGMLRVFEPTDAEILTAAPRLAMFNNDTHNAAMMTNTRLLTATDIVDFYQSLRDSGGRPLLLQRDGILMGDADFRNVSGAAAEFAIMIGARTDQSRGAGTRFAAMAHLAAREVLGYERVYVTIVPANLASRRMCEKLGYQLDDSSYAVSLLDGEDEIAMAIDWNRFEHTQAEFLATVVIAARKL